MAGRFAEDFDGVATIAQLFNGSVSGGTGVAGKWVNGNASATSQLTLDDAGRTGRGLKSIATSGNTMYSQPTNLGTTVFVGIAYKPVSVSGTKVIHLLWNLGLSGVAVQLARDANTVQVFTAGNSTSATLRITSGSVLATGVWTYLELKAVYGTSTGEVSLRVNGAHVGTVGSIDVRGNGATEEFGAIGPFYAGFNGLSQDNGDMMDDLYICDSNGSKNNTFLGAVRVRPIHPSGNGNSSQLVGSDGNSTDNYKLVSEDRIDNGVGAILGTTGAFLTTPDTSPLDITGDLDVRAAVTLADWTPNMNHFFAAKFEGSSNQSFEFYTHADGSGKLVLFWTTGGTSATAKTAISTVGISAADGTILGVRAVLDVNAGGVQPETKFYTKTITAGSAEADISSNTGWTQLGTTVVTSGGVTSIFSGSAPLRIGIQDAVLGANMTVHAMVLKNGIDGTTVANPDLANQPSGTTDFTDTSARAWHLVTGRDDSDFVQASADNEKDTYAFGNPTLNGNVAFIQVVGQTQQITSGKRLFYVNRLNGLEYHVNAQNLSTNLRESWGIIEEKPPPGLYLRGAGWADTPDTAVLDITGDIDMRIALALSDWSPSASYFAYNLVAKWTDSGNLSQQSYGFQLLNPGHLRLIYDTDGTGASSSFPSTTTDADNPKIPDGVFTGIRMRRVGSQLTWEKKALTSPSAAAAEINSSSGWTQIRTFSETSTAFYSGTGLLRVGAAQGDASTIEGYIAAMELRDSAGNVVAVPNFAAQADGTTSFNDSLGLTWTLRGDATIKSSGSGAFSSTDLNNSEFGTIQRPA